MTRKQRKIQVENPNTNTSNSILDIKDMSQEVPELEELYLPAGSLSVRNMAY